MAMKTFSRIFTSFVAIGAFAAVVGLSGPAPAQRVAVLSGLDSSQNQCASFPKVSWWGKISHERVARYVDKKFDGNWKRYLAVWERQLKIMVDIYDRDSTAVIKKRGIRLSGDKLGNYIVSIVKRISVTRCLAGRKAYRDQKAS